MSWITRMTAVWALAALGVTAAPTSAGAQQWIAAWGSSLQGPSPDDWSITDATIRLIARSTIAGDRVRIRLENMYGDTPLRVGAASIALRNIGPWLVPGSSRPVRFGGDGEVTIPPGEHVVSDAVDLVVGAGQDLAVSLYVPGRSVRSSIHRNALTTSYVTAAGSGDQTEVPHGDPFNETTPWMHWLSAIEVRSSSARGAIVAFGDSITDGSCATRDGHDRWVDVLYTRLVHAAGAAQLGMVNAGIGGNTAIRVPPVGSTPAVERMDRDVLSLSGISHLVIFLGTNDLRRNATAEQVIAGLDEIVTRAKSRGLTVIAATMIPRNPVPSRGLPPDLGFDATRNVRRHQINAWIRSHERLDAVLDFDALVRHVEDPDLINPVYDCDGIHPNVFGYAAMGRSIDLSVFGVEH